MAAIVCPTKPMAPMRALDMQMADFGFADHSVLAGTVEAGRRGRNRACPASVADHSIRLVLSAERSESPHSNNDISEEVAAVNAG